MGHVVDAAAERAPAPAIEDVEGERRMRLDGRLQGRRQPPRLEANAGNVFAGARGRGQRNDPAIAGDDVAAGIQILDLHLQPLDRGVDETRSHAGCRVFAKYVPRLQRLSQFQAHAATVDRAVERKAKLALGMKPVRIEMIAGTAKITQNVEKVLPDKVPQHEAIVQGGAPAHQCAALRLTPEP